MRARQRHKAGSEINVEVLKEENETRNGDSDGVCRERERGCEGLSTLVSETPAQSVTGEGHAAQGGKCWIVPKS